MVLSSPAAVTWQDAVCQDGTRLYLFVAMYTTALIKPFVNIVILCYSDYVRVARN